MNRKLILVVAVVVLGLLAWWLKQRSAATTLDVPLSDFGVQDTAAVDRIFISDVAGRSIDLRRDGGLWRLNDAYLARKSDVDLLLRTFKRIEVKSPVSKSATPTALRIMGANAKRVDIYQGGDRPVKSWIVGHATKDNFGTHMVLELPDKGRSSAPFIVGMSGFTGVLSTRFRTELDSWRSTTVWDIRDPYQLAEVRMELPRGLGSGYRIEQGEQGELRFSDLTGRPLPMDSSSVKLLLRAFQALNYEYIARGLERSTWDSLFATPADHVLGIRERSGTSGQVKFWYMPFTGEVDTTLAYRPTHDPNRMYAQVEDSLLVVVQRDLFDPLLQPAENLLP